MTPRRYRNRRFGRLRWALWQHLIGWDLYEPDFNGIAGPLHGLTYRVKPIGWRRMLFGRVDGSRQ